MRSSIVAAFVLGTFAASVARADPLPTPQGGPAAPAARPGAEGDPVVPSTAAMEEGRTHFNRGVAFFREKDYAAALVEFRRAYDSAPSTRILFNLGRTFYELQDYAGALSSFERYLAESGAQLPVARRAEVEADVARLRARVGEVVITSSAAGAQIAVDDAPIGRAPLAGPVLVTAGRRRVSGTLAGHMPATKIIDIAGGDRLRVELDLPDVALAEAPVGPRPEAAAPIAVPPRAKASPEQLPSALPMWIGLGVTGALLVGTAVLGGLAIDANHTFQVRLREFPGSQSAVDDARTRVHTFALAADLFGVATAVAGGITLYTALSPSRPRRDPPLRVEVQGSGVRAIGAF